MAKRSIADSYIRYVNQEVKEKSEKGWNHMVQGFQANKWRARLLPKGNLTRGYQKLEAMMMSLVADALSHKDRYVWGNIFAPCEIMQCFGVRTLSIECLSCYFPAIIWRTILSTADHSGHRRPGQQGSSSQCRGRGDGFCHE